MLRFPRARGGTPLPRTKQIPRCARDDRNGVPFGALNCDELSLDGNSPYVQ